jgi:methylmalonyl-CoA/ethylmalonyl-CoA epimerase
MSDPAHPQRIGQISIRALDLERATAFYRDVLQLRFLFAAGPTMSFFELGGIRLMLGLPSEPRFDHPASILYLDVADLHAAHARLAARGVVFEREPFMVAALATGDLWMAFFRDSEGNVLALQSEIARPA